MNSPAESKPTPDHCKPTDSDALVIIAEREALLNKISAATAERDAANVAAIAAQERLDNLERL